MEEIFSYLLYLLKSLYLLKFFSCDLQIGWFNQIDKEKLQLKILKEESNLKKLLTECYA